MEIMHQIAVRNGLTVLFHEKPFKGINGSGKHNNWGLNTDDNSNMFKAGKTKEEQTRFIVFVSALMYAIQKHGDVLRIGVSSSGKFSINFFNSGNDHRLGGITI
jgi:glutamine synthetase